MNDSIVELLQQAGQLKTDLDNLRPLDKEREAIVLQKLRLDWNYHSNHLEGNSLTFGETKALILFGITAQGKPLQDHIEITGHDEAIKWIEDVVKKREPLTESFIRQLHTLLLKKPYKVDAITTDGQPTKKLIKVGEYKTTPNHVETKTGEIFRFASPEETPAKMYDLLEWFKKMEADKETNPILFAADFHYKFIRIHPFDDGNGRMARMLMNFILLQYGYPPVIVRTGEKAQYIAALEQADADIFDPFIEFIITNQLRSLEIMLKGARGESIEEPDDLDKELDLLKQKLNAKKKTFEEIDTSFFIKNNLSPLILEAYKNSLKFEPFFSIRTLKISLTFNKEFQDYGAKRSFSLNLVGSSNEIIDKKILLLKQKIEIFDIKTIHHITIKLSFNGFSLPKKLQKGYSKSWKLSFKDKHYSTYEGSRLLYSERPLYNSLTSQEIEKIISSFSIALKNILSKNI
ncbi:MAG: Fic family protein [Bacteroidetes bacterium]|nr:MAG: Fic family protein [Bacteroidota bacterium]